MHYLMKHFKFIMVLIFSCFIVACSAQKGKSLTVSSSYTMENTRQNADPYAYIVKKAFRLPSSGRIEIADQEKDILVIVPENKNRVVSKQDCSDRNIQGYMSRLLGDEYRNYLEKTEEGHAMTEVDVEGNEGLKPRYELLQTNGFFTYFPFTKGKTPKGNGTTELWCRTSLQIDMSKTGIIHPIELDLADGNGQTVREAMFGPGRSHSGMSSITTGYERKDLYNAILDYDVILDKDNQIRQISMRYKYSFLRDFALLMSYYQ